MNSKKPSTIIVEGFFYVGMVRFLVELTADDVGEVLRVVLEALAGEAPDIAESD